MKNNTVPARPVFLLLVAACCPSDRELLASGAEEDGKPLTIVITPQWQPLNPQKVPLSVEVLSSRELDETGVSDTQQLQDQVAGFSMQTNAVLGQPYLRGIGSDVVSAGSDASVATLVDGVYMTRSVRSRLKFYDIEHVDIIKGPQGVKLGRNVVGGAVSVVSKQPRPYFESSVDALYGSFNRRQARAMVNTPLGKSAFSLRVSGLVQARDGYFHNRLLDRDLGDEDYLALRSRLRYHPSADVDTVLSVEVSRDRGNSVLGFQPDPEHGVHGGILSGGTVPDDPWKVNQDPQPSAATDSSLVSLRVQRDLGDMQLVSISAFQYTDFEVVLDIDGTEANFSTNEPQETSRAISQEIRLSSAGDGETDWSAGVYYLYEDADQVVDVRLPLLAVRNRADASVKTRSWAIFGELSRRFGTRWRGEAGLRYTYDRRWIDMVQGIEDPGGFIGAPGTLSLNQDESRSWDSFTPELGISYTPTNDILAWARISKGYKSGGFNTTAVQPAFDPEDLRAFEAGFKSQSRAGNGHFNATYFYYDYRDIQLLTPPENAPIGTFPTVINAAEATIQGVDMQAGIQLTRALELSLGAELLNARFDHFVSIDPNNPADNPNRRGDPLPQSPDISLALGSSYRWWNGIGRVTARLGWRYQSSVYFNPYKDAAVRQGSYSLFDASMALEDRRGRWYLELFGRNLGDERYARSMIRVDPTVGVMRFWGAPATWGLRLGTRF